MAQIVAGSFVDALSARRMIAADYCGMFER